MEEKPLTKTSIIVRGKGLLSSNVYGDIVLISIKSGLYYDLDEVGSFIWDVLEKPLPVTGIIEQVLLNYEIERSACEEDVMAFLRDLNDYNLLEIK